MKLFPVNNQFQENLYTFELKKKKINVKTVLLRDYLHWSKLQKKCVHLNAIHIFVEFKEIQYFPFFAINFLL